MPAAVRDIRSAKKPPTAADDAPVLPVKVPKAPPKLTPAEAAVFNSTARILVGMRVMNEGGLDALVLYSINWVEAMDAHEHIRDEGAIVPGVKGHPVMNPWLAVRRKAEDRCLKIMVEFGLTPSAMTRVSKITP